MYAETVDITPKLAATFLERNTRNRNLTARVVDSYAREMTLGNWKSNGETIKISHEGVVLDGQHRLAAIVASGVTLENALVVFDLDESTQYTMDSGRKRTAADAMAINGDMNVNVLAAITRRALLWEAGHHKFGNALRPSTTELLEFRAKYPSLARSAEIGVQVQRGYKPANATVTGTVHHILNRIPDARPQAAAFFAHLSTGVELGPNDPILTLRNRLLRDKVTSRHVPFHQNVGLYFRAWNAVREGRTLTTILHTAEEPMVMPV